MEINQLNKVIKEQHECLQNFLTVVKLQQKSLIENDLEGLEDSIAKEEKILTLLNRIKDEKARVIKNLAEENNIILKNFSLGDLLENFKNKTEIKFSNLEKVQFSIKNLILQIDKINQQNKILIEHSRNFIKETINILVNKNKPILDRKV